MQLKKFKVSRYRSIKETLPISLEHNLTIIGPNNEGKSNLVRSLVTSLTLLEEHAVQPRRAGVARSSLRFRSRTYQWDVDFPLNLQQNLDGFTEFKLEFNLTNQEQQDFLSEIGSSINDKLPITIKIGRNQIPNFEVNKPGKGYSSLTNKSSEIAAFIGSRLSINYIKAVRTSRDSAKSVESLVSTALRRVEKTDEYREALRTIQELQRPVLDELQENLQATLETFVPGIRSVELTIREGSREALRSVRIGIDDGQLTSLENKGDGIISLVGMALLSRVEDFANSEVNMVLAIEEPESHLHPRAIHSIRSILDGLGTGIQVIITTHSPALVNRINLSGNILVQNNKAKVVSEVSEIRDALGVRVSDNLTNARIIVVCEGDNDKRPLGKILSDIEPSIASSINMSEISFSCLSGSGNLSYLVSTLQNSICEPVCLLDNDSAGMTAYNIALQDGILSDADVVFTSRLGKDESEFEDLIREDIVDDIMLKIFKVNAAAIPNGLKKKKFSKRAEAAFIASGRPWNDGVKQSLKAKISDKCEELGISAIDENCKGPLVALAAIIKERLGQ